MPGHSHGPDSVEMRDARCATSTTAIGRLVDGLAARALLDEVNLIITSDHGLAAVAPGNTVAIEDMVDARDAAVVLDRAVRRLQPAAGREREAYAKSLGMHDRYECWRKERAFRSGGTTARIRGCPRSSARCTRAGMPRRAPRSRSGRRA